MAARDRVLLPSLVGYRSAWLAKDVVAGLAAGAVVVPQAMAYATIAELPVQVGLYTCIVPMLVYALLGGSRAMSVSTTSTIATLSATTLVTAGVAAGSDDATGALAALTLLVGVVLLIARLLRLGALVENISQATVLGVKIGVGATVAVAQIPKLLGQPGAAAGEGLLRSLAAIAEGWRAVNLPTLALGCAAIAVLVIFARFLPRVPGPLIVVVGAILVAWLFDVEAAGIALIDPVPSGLPPFTLPVFADLDALIGGALAIAVMAFLESASVARSLRGRDDPPIDADQEILAASASNLAGALFGAMPSAGGFSQSAVNRAAGARSQVAALATVLLAVLVAVLLGPVLSQLPQAALAAIVLVAVAGLIDLGQLATWWRYSPIDFWIAAVVAVIGMTAGLLAAVAAGIGLTLYLVLRELNTPHLTRLGRRNDILALRIDEGLYAANVLAYRTAIAAMAERERVRYVVLDVARLEIVTVTVLDAIRELDRELAASDIELHFARVPEAATAIAVHFPWFDTARAAGRVHDDVDSAFAALG